MHVTGVILPRHAVCDQPVDGLTSADFLYFDKDGFELSKAEQKFYRAMNYPIDNPILNHTCWQEDWIVGSDLIDHAMLLCRCSYQGEAREQIKEWKPKAPFADYLLQTRARWGFDFALDAVRDDTIFEVIHIEVDSYDYDHFCEMKDKVETCLLNMDWENAADQIWNNKSKWINLKGFDQNHWKANNLLGWNKAEYTEKTF